jgi:integrase/recombinase XerD
MAPQIGFGQLVQDFFLRRLVAHRGASARTVESYRDAFELLFGCLEQRTGKPPSALRMADLDAPAVLDFLDHLETGRGKALHPGQQNFMESDTPGSARRPFGDGP